MAMSLFAVLSRLDRGGPQTTSKLAAEERMRPQSMAQTIADLEREGYVQRRPDDEDRRQILVDLTPQGRQIVRAERRRRQDWLSRAIADELTADEQGVLVRAIDLLRRIAGSDAR